jgi:hypothetical protein
MRETGVVKEWRSHETGKRAGRYFHFSRLISRMAYRRFGIFRRDVKDGLKGLLMFLLARWS